MKPPFFADLVRPELAELAPYAAGGVEAPIRLDANENAFPLSAAAREDLARELAQVDLNRYPDPRQTRLREIVAKEMDVAPERLIFGAGVDEVIGMIATALARPRPGQARARILFPWPSFVMFRITTLARGLEPVMVPLGPKWELGPDELASAVRDARPNVVFLPTPNNPTGNSFARETIEAAIDAAPDALVVIDEAYFDFSGTTYADLARARPNVALFRTLSKAGLAGLRVGYLLGDAALVYELEKVRQPYNVTSLSLRAAELCLVRYRDELRAQVARIVEMRGRLIADLAGLPGLEVFPSDANFILVRTANATEVFRGLAANGVLVRSFDAPKSPLAGCLRITVGRPEENDRLLESLRSVLAAR
jgi:histidinol-phosphate aminotransferase